MGNQSVARVSEVPGTERPLGVRLLQRYLDHTSDSRGKTTVIRGSHTRVDKHVWRRALD